jgi:hypothetical protein
MKQAGVAKVRPQLDRDRVLPQLEVGVELLDIARPGNNCGHRRVREGKL